MKNGHVSFMFPNGEKYVNVIVPLRRLSFHLTCQLQKMFQPALILQVVAEPPSAAWEAECKLVLLVPTIMCCCRKGVFPATKFFF